jgi:perosamine synthetase
MIPRTCANLGVLELLSILWPGRGRCEFEEAVATSAGTQHALAFTYGHAGFLALLQALNLTQAEIILPAYTCAIMAEVVVATGNIPVFVDINPTNFNMDPATLKFAITAKTRAIVATHMFGYPCDVDAIREVAGGEQIFIIEDAALMFPVSTSASTWLRGDAGMFSFGPGKPLFTIRGGVVVTNDSHLYEKLRSYRDRKMNRLPPKQWAKRWGLLMIHYLLTKDAFHNLAGRFNLSKDTLYQLARSGRVAHKGSAPSASSLPGDYATRYADFQARLGLTQLAKADFILSRRRSLAKRYDELLQQIPGLAPAPIVDGACYSLYTVRVTDRDRISFRPKMRARGIETGHTFNYALCQLAKYRPYVQSFYPNAEQASREVVNLPAHPALTEKQIQFISSNIRQALKSGP